MSRHALTIDVEEWFQVENLTHLYPAERWAETPSRLRKQINLVLELLARSATRATFFVLGAAAEREPRIVREIVEAGHELASHGWSHELISRQSPEEFREETKRSKGYLEDLGGCAIRGYRASTFSITQRTLWALDILAELGFQYDSSIAPLRHDRYGIPDAPENPHARQTTHGPILECPISFGTVLGARVPLGGGFARLLPIGWTARALRRRSRNGSCGMLYIHPWELDSEQPIPDELTGLRRFRHVHGLSRFHGKIESLLERESFAPLGELVAGRLLALHG